MDIQDLGAIGELVGSIAVVVTLIYLAQQIRQNTRELQSTNSESFVDRHYNLVTPMAMDKKFAQRWIKAGNNFEELDEDEQQQFIMYEWRAITSWNHYFHLRQQGLVADWHWRELEWIIERIGERQCVQVAWQIYKEAYDEEFQEYLDKYLAPKSRHAQ